jgi:4-amino-4-deoxy-L-arabinose transferase-like glycosyltransferase
MQLTNGPEASTQARRMSIGSLARSALSPIERLVAALSNSSRRERTAIGVVIAYVAIWTVYGVLAKGSEDVHFDIGELVAWAREPALGYAKHPPLAVWVVSLWFAVFPLADWACYLLAMTAVGIALWIAWRLFARWLDGEKRVVALALLTLIPLLNFHALKFNPNVVIIPLWALTTLWFLRSFESRRPADAALAGVCAAAAVLGKYWSFYLLTGLAAAALMDRRRGAYLRSAAPWVTMGVGLAVLAPHGVWLATHDYAPLRYAVSASAGGTAVQALRAAMVYLAGCAGYVAVPVCFAILATWPSRAAIRDMLWPRADSRRFAAIAFWLPLLLPALVTLVAGGRTTALWTMPSWTLLPVVLLSSPLVTVLHAATLRIAAFTTAFPMIMVAVAPIVAVVIQRVGVSHYGAHYRLVAAAIEREWRQVSKHPIRLIGGEYFLVRGVAFYLSDRPLIVDNALSIGGRAINQQRFETEGIALVCPIVDVGCTLAISSFAAKEPSARRTRTEVVSRYFGLAGPPEDYVIVVAPGPL